MAIEVVGAVIVKGDKILAARRPFNKSLGGLWEFPGGKLETGEKPQEALRREIMEELKCKVEVGEFITNSIYAYDFATISLSTYFCTIIKGNLQPSEHIDLKWLKFNQLNDVRWTTAGYKTINILNSIRWQHNL